MKKTIASFLSLLLVIFLFAQEGKKLPIIDVHVHAMAVNPAFAADLCPWFLSNMPGSGPKQDAPSFNNTDCVKPLKVATSTDDYIDQLVAATERLNVTMVISGDAAIIHELKRRAPKKIIPSIGLSNSTSITPKAFRDSLSNGFYQVMGEVAPQYQGLSPSDITLDEYFAIAEELGVPVGIHMGTGGNGMANIT